VPPETVTKITNVRTLYNSHADSQYFSAKIAVLIKKNMPLPPLGPDSIPGITPLTVSPINPDTFFPFRSKVDTGLFPYPGEQ